MGIAIRTTVGAPRWFDHLDVMVHAKLCTPYGVFGVYEDHDEYRSHYFDRLNHHGRGVLVELDSITKGQGGVLVCWCDLDKTWCHRTLLAEWLEARWGYDVPEQSGPPRLWAVP